MLNTKEILKRVGNVIKSKKNKDIALSLKSEPTTCSNWKTRNAIPWEELFVFSQKYKLSLDWLLTGKDQQNNFMCGWPEDAVEYCQKLKSVLENGEEKEITTIKEMIDIYINKCKAKKRVVKKGAG